MASDSPQSTQPKPASSSSGLNDLAAALGGGPGMPLPDGLVPGGDCSPPPADAAQDMEAQAKAAVPLKEGLTFAYTWMRTPQEEYECLIQVTKVDAGGIETTLSCDHPTRRGPFVRRVCRADLRSARLLHTVYGALKIIGASGEEEPETITGATAFSLSSEHFAELKRTGTMTHHYVEIGPSSQLIKNGVGELHVEGRETMPVIVNDRAVEIPVIKTRGVSKFWILGQTLDTQDVVVILDDERFPLLIDQKSSSGDVTASRIHFAKITYPSDGRGRGAGGGGPLAGGGGSLEGGLLDNRRVDVYGIYFDFNSDRIRPESRPVLEEIGSMMKRHPDWRLTINGHTDNIGGHGASNLDLSRRRSEAVRTALTKHTAFRPIASPPADTVRVPRRTPTTLQRGGRAIVASSSFDSSG